jgi:hypothetical protein
MGNQNNQDIRNDENSTFYDQADGKFNKSIQAGQSEKLAAGVSSDEEEADPDEQVRETEDASLQDDSYSFDEDNTGNEEYHDAEDVEDFDIDNDDDFVQ